MSVWVFLLDSVVSVWLFSSAPSCWSLVAGQVTCCVHAGTRGHFHWCGRSNPPVSPRWGVEALSPPPVSTRHSSLLYFPAVFTWKERKMYKYLLLHIPSKHKTIHFQLTERKNLWEEACALHLTGKTVSKSSEGKPDIPHKHAHKSTDQYNPKTGNRT